MKYEYPLKNNVNSDKIKFKTKTLGSIILICVFNHFCCLFTVCIFIQGKFNVNTPFYYQ